MLRSCLFWSKQIAFRPMVVCDRRAVGGSITQKGRFVLLWLIWWLQPLAKWLTGWLKRTDHPSSQRANVPTNLLFCGGKRKIKKNIAIFVNQEKSLSHSFRLFGRRRKTHADKFSPLQQNTTTPPAAGIPTRITTKELYFNTYNYISLYISYLYVLQWRVSHYLYLNLKKKI